MRPRGEGEEEVGPDHCSTRFRGGMLVPLPAIPWRIDAQFRRNRPAGPALPADDRADEDRRAATGSSTRGRTTRTSSGRSPTRRCRWPPRRRARSSSATSSRIPASAIRRSPRAGTRRCRTSPNGRMVMGIGRGDSSRRVVGLQPVKVAEFERRCAMIKDLMNGPPGRLERQGARAEVGAGGAAGHPDVGCGLRAEGACGRGPSRRRRDHPARRPGDHPVDHEHRAAGRRGGGPRPVAS